MGDLCRVGGSRGWIVWMICVVSVEVEGHHHPPDARLPPDRTIFAVHLIHGYLPTAPSSQFT